MWGRNRTWVLGRRCVTGCALGALLVGAVGAVGCGAKRPPRHYEPEPIPKLAPVATSPDAAPAQAEAATPASDSPPPGDDQADCGRASVGPTRGRPRPLEYRPVYPLRSAAGGRAAEALGTQAARLVACFYPGMRAVDVDVTRDEQHAEGGLAVAVVGAKGKDCKTYEVEFELQVDWTRLGTQLDVRRSTVPYPSSSKCGLVGGFREHSALLAPWGIKHGNDQNALGLAVLSYATFHPATARTASCVLASLERKAAAEGGAGRGSKKWREAGLYVLQQLLQITPSEEQLVKVSQQASARHDLGLSAEQVKAAVVEAGCFGG